MSKVRLLDTVDIFDFYGCEFLFNNPEVSPEDKSQAEDRIHDIHDLYVNSTRERIKAECKFLGIDDYEGFTIRKAVKLMQKILEKDCFDQADNVRQSGEGMNLMGSILKAHQMAGGDMEGINMGAFGVAAQDEPVSKNSIDADSLLKDPKWHVIAEAFINLEDANTTKDMILSIDHLNDLQHNSFHLLIDLQTGRMLDNQSEGKMHGKHSDAVDTVKDVLDIKLGASTPLQYADRMSTDVAKLIRSYRFAM